MVALLPQDDFGFKPLHAKRLDKWRAARGRAAAAPAAAVAGREGEPPRAALPHESVTPVQRSGEAIRLADGSNLRVGALIGRGGSATVHKARWIERGQERHVAVKRLVTGASERDMARFQKELQLISLAAKRCENVCRVHGAFQHEGEMVLVMKEYVEDLTSLLSREGPLPVVRALRYAQQICRGIVSLHDERITIFDLKPGNILLDENDQIAITDFGISKLQGTMTNTTTTRASEQASVGVAGGTPQYQSPEQYDPEEYGSPATPADLWAFGCVLLSLLTGADPWPQLSGTQIMVAILNKKRNPEIPTHVPVEVAEILRKCLTHNPKGRPSAAQVLAMLTSASAAVSITTTISCPLGASGKHIFLSYRRIDSHLAATVKHALEKLGYAVFFDRSQTSELGFGDFTSQREQALRGTPVFVLLLTGSVGTSGGPEFLCIKQPADAARLEVRAALAMNKLIVPFYTVDFDIAQMVTGQDLPEDVEGLRRQSSFVRHDVDYFDASVQRIHEMIEAEAATGRLAKIGTYAGELPPEPAAVDDPNRLATRTKCTAEMQAWAYADSIIQSSWAKRDQYEFGRLVQVEEIDNPRLKAKFDEYKATLPGDSQGDQLVFHGCSSEALHSIIQFGFDRSYWKSAAGDWQRFGPAFYFALNSSKSHEYPLKEMQALPPNSTHTKSMLLCKIAKGNCLQTSHNMSHLSGSAPLGFHSIHGKSTPGGPLNFDELVVFDEAAILPYAVATYTFQKLPIDLSTKMAPVALREDSSTATNAQQQEGVEYQFQLTTSATGSKSVISDALVESQSTTTESPFAFLTHTDGAKAAVGGVAPAEAPAVAPAVVKPAPPALAATMSTADSLHSFHAGLASLSAASSSSLGVLPLASASFSGVDLLSSPAPSQTEGHDRGNGSQMEFTTPSPELPVTGDLMDMFTPRQDDRDARRSCPVAPTSMPELEQQGTQVDTVAAYLSSLGLGTYAEKMIEDGFTDLEELRSLSREEVETLCNPFLKKVAASTAMNDQEAVDELEPGGQWLVGGAGTFASASTTSVSSSGRGSMLLYDPAQRQPSGGSGGTSIGGGAPKQYAVDPDNAYMRNIADRAQLIPGTIYISVRNLSFRSDSVGFGEVNAKCPLAQVVQVTQPVACDIPAHAPLQAEVVDYRAMSQFEVTFIHTESLMKKAVLMKKTEDKLVVVQFIVATETATRIYEVLVQSSAKHKSNGSQRDRSRSASTAAVEVTNGVAWAAPSRLSMNR